MGFNVENDVPDIFKNLTLYDHQIQTCKFLLSKKSVVLIAPTGSGKTICYQIPVLVSSLQTIVISPLISIMQDQVEKNRKLGISSAMLSSYLTSEQSWKIIARWLAKSLKILFVSPEKLDRDRNLIKVLQKQHPGLIVIDEAHCIVTWGQSFRQAYRQLKEFLQLFETTPILAATATARPVVKNEIMRTIRRKDIKVIAVKIKLPSLSINVAICQNFEEKIEKIKALLLSETSLPCIVFCLTRKRCEILATILKKAGFECQPYHSGMTFEERENTTSKFISSDNGVLVATSAFEMGVDKKNVRQVIHFDIPSSIESYIQGIGRAGRDGVAASATLIYDEKTLDIIDRLAQSFKSLEGSLSNLSSLHKLMQYAKTSSCRINFLNDLMFPDELELKPCGICDNCIRKNPADISMRKIEIKEALRKWRNAKAMETTQKHFRILTDRQIDELSSWGTTCGSKTYLNFSWLNQKTGSFRKEIIDILRE